MGRRNGSFVIFIQLTSLLLYSVSKSIAAANKAETSGSISTVQKDITTPITTVPIVTQTPVLNPTVSNPDSSSSGTTNNNNNNNPNSPLSSSPPSSSSGGGSWCIASKSASETALQAALDYACGYGGVDCSEIQSGGRCYNPNTVLDHASYAFNTFYQNNPIPTSCIFGGTALTTSTDPSSGTCQFQSTSTASSILNTTNSSGSRVYGAGPITPTTSAAAAATTMPISIHQHFHMLIFILLSTHY